MRAVKPEAGAADGLPTARLAEIYSRTAAFYDQVAQPFQEKAKLALLGLLDLEGAGRVLEIGVGTGWLFSRVVARCGPESTLGLELAAGMLELTGRRIEDERGVKPAPLVLADGAALPFRSAAFDVVLSTYTLEVLPEQTIGSVLAECRRVLSPSGSLALVYLTDGRGPDRAVSEDWRRRFARDPEAFGGARPVSLAKAVPKAGLAVVKRRYIGGAASWPSEVLIARPQESPLTQP